MEQTPFNQEEEPNFFIHFKLHLRKTIVFTSTDLSLFYTFFFFKR